MKPEKDFSFQQRRNHHEWRKENISTSDWGWQNGKRYEHIIPREIWLETVWEGIRNDLDTYLSDQQIHSHTGTHNLLSSWVACANLYFPARTNPSLKKLMVEFLRQSVSPTVKNISKVELEFSFDQKGKPQLHPAALLGEREGIRGSGQTSPDVAFMVETENGKGILLTECKYTEHSFYPCSARRIKDRGERKGNPDPSRCTVPANGYDYSKICHQTSETWGRSYWQHLQLTPFANVTLKCCPATTAGYQLFRQHALANGIRKSGEYDLVASCVALDERNTTLLNSLRATGIADLRTQWGQLFDCDVLFTIWTHQEWVEFVRTNQVNGEHDLWLTYLEKRYGY